METVKKWAIFIWKRCQFLLRLSHQKINNSWKFNNNLNRFAFQSIIMVLKKVYALEFPEDLFKDLAWTYKVFQVSKVVIFLRNLKMSEKCSNKIRNVSEIVKKCPNISKKRPQRIPKISVRCLKSVWESSIKSRKILKYFEMWQNVQCHKKSSN